MNSKKLNLICSFISLVLTIVLTGTILFAWYTNSKNVASHQIQATTENDYIRIKKSMVFQNREEGKIFPENESDHVSGLIDGNYFYYAIEIECLVPKKTGNLNIEIGQINGGNFFKNPDGTNSIYNMCDIYQIGLEEVWIGSNQQTLSDTQKEWIPFEHEASSTIARNCRILNQFEWQADQNETITFLFKIKMEIDGVIPPEIDRNQMANKTLKFQSILVTFD